MGPALYSPVSPIYFGLSDSPQVPALSLHGVAFMKIIRDNIHGDIEFRPEEMRLLHTAEFERLHGCRQLGLSHLVYPGAKHSRFEHVLGVMHVATRIAKRMKKQGQFFQKESGGDELMEILRFGALLPDMGHVPFRLTL